MSSPDPIPDAIAELLTATEVENIRQRNGWATGTVCLATKDDDTAERYENAYIELLNGDGVARRTSGVKFLVITDTGDLHEAYAHGSKEAFEEVASSEGYYVAEYDRDNVDYGNPNPIVG